MAARPLPMHDGTEAGWRGGGGSWRAADLMHQARVGHTATLLDDGRVLVAGGFDDSAGFLASVEIYDPASGRWEAAAALSHGRTGHTATVLEDGAVLVAGGAADGGGVAGVEVYDPAADRWTERSPMSTPRAHHASVRIAGGAVLCTGGAALHGPVARLASVEIYDPVLDSWSRAASMLAGRHLHSATVLDGDTVLVAGGRGEDDSLEPAEVYAPSRDGWTRTLGPNTAPGRHSATRLNDGSVLITGGGSSGAVSAVRRYWPARRTFVAEEPMPSRRRAHTGTLCADGRVLVAGGWNAAGRALGAAELYDPCRGTWTPAGSTAVRAAHTATRLAGGGILLAGGLTRWGDRLSTLASAELFTVDRGA
jgi:N-acetylneuraminic acid mutarotase